MVTAGRLLRDLATEARGEARNERERPAAGGWVGGASVPKLRTGRDDRLGQDANALETAFKTVDKVVYRTLLESDSSTRALEVVLVHVA